MDYCSYPNNQLCAQALNMWANFIETENPAMSAKDASGAKKPYAALDLEQMELVVKLRKLAITLNAKP